MNIFLKKNSGKKKNALHFTLQNKLFKEKEKNITMFLMLLLLSLLAFHRRLKMISEALELRVESQLVRVCD